MRKIFTNGIQNLNVALVEDVREFAALEEEWAELYRESPLATPFQSWAWLYSWWESYGEGRYELRLIMVRSQEGLLVGIVPLMLERWLGGLLGRLLFVGAGQAEYLDVLARGGWETRVLEAGAWALRQMDGWQVADVDRLPPTAVVWGLFGKWDGFWTCAHQLNYTMMEVKPWDELLRSLRKRLRGEVRRTLRRAEEDGVSGGLARPEDTERAARRLVALHRELWRGRDIWPERLTERYESFLVAAARRMAADGLGSIYEFWVDGEVIISNFLIFGHQFDGAYMVGASQESRKRYQWSSLAVRAEVDIARSRNSSYVSWMTGDPPHKLRWALEVIPGYRVVLGRNAIFWAPYAGYWILPLKAKRYVESESAPRWTKYALAKYRVARPKVGRYLRSESTPRWLRSAAPQWLKKI
jgi:hypothetical protein